MKIFSRAIITGLIMAAVSLMPMNQAKAQSVAEPAIVVSMAKISEQMDDIGYLADSSGFGQMSFLLKMQVEQFLKGVDDSKPAGVMMFFEDGAEEPTMLGFFPVSNMDDVLNTISNQAEVEEGDDFTVIIPDDGSELLMKQIGDYAFISDREEIFEAAPADPSEMLGDLHSRYNMGARVYAQRIPESLRTMALDMIEEGYADSMAEMGEIPGELQEKNFEMQMATIKSLINETEELVVGFNADQDNGSLNFDFQITGLDGSKLANQSDAQNNIEPTKFAGFLMNDAALTVNTCSVISEEDIEQYQDMLSQIRDEAYKELGNEMPEEEAKIIEGIANEFFEVLEETIKEGRIDMGAVVTTNETLEFALGMQVADPGKFEDGVKEFVALVKDQPEVQENVEFNLNSGEMNGLRLHEIIIQVPNDEEEMVDVLGEEMTLILGIGEKAIYLAGGSVDPKELLESAMNGSPSDSEFADNVAMQYNLFLTPVLRMVAGIEGEEMMEQMADKLDESGRDRIRFTIEMIDNGMKGQVEIQDGILEIIGVAAQAMGGMMGGGGSDF